MTSGRKMPSHPTGSTARQSAPAGEPRITAVIVTYNNPFMLEQVLRDLCRQTMKLHKILVIDNSDETDATRGVTVKFPSVSYIQMAENVGTAGGFHTGLREAVRDCEWVLTLDDDVRLRADSMAALYRGFLDLQREGHRLGAVRAVGARHGGGTPNRLDDFAWRGTLISAEAIRRIGLPLPEYFIYADDVEFSMRLGEHGYEAYDIPDSKIMEQRTWDKLTKRILGKNVTCYAQDFRFYYALRNSIHAYKKHDRYRSLLRTIVYAVKMFLFFCVLHKEERGQKLRAVFQGVADGMRSRLGKNKRYLPGSL